MGFIESLRPVERRFLFGRRYDLVDPINDMTYGYIFELGPVTILKVMGWYKERMTVVKFFDREFVW